MSRGKTGTADVHMHTRYSDGRPSVRELLDYVDRHTTLDVIAITDHDTIAGAREAQDLCRREPSRVEVIVGEEVSTRDGHLVGLFLQERIPPGMSAHETVVAIHAQGGLAFAPHPFFRAHQAEDRPITMLGLGMLVDKLDLDALETINATPLLQRANRRAQYHNHMVRHLPVLGNSDGHIKAALGKGYTTFPGSTADDLFRAIKEGRTAAHAKAYNAGELLAYLRFWLRLTGGKLPRRALSGADVSS